MIRLIKSVSLTTPVNVWHWQCLRCRLIWKDYARPGECPSYVMEGERQTTQDLGSDHIIKAKSVANRKVTLFRRGRPRPRSKRSVFANHAASVYEKVMS